MPFGLLIGVLAFGAMVALTLIAPRRPRWLAGLAYRVAAAYNEAPFPFVLLVAATAIIPLVQGDITTPAGWAVIALAGLVVLGLLTIAWRGTRARPAVMRALDDALGTGWREEIHPSLAAGLRTRPPLLRILLMPFVFRPRGVRRTRNVRYGDAGRFHLLDIYHHRSRPRGAPVLVYLHGGGFHGGRKSVEGRALLFRLAGRGWVTISANYRLRPQATFADHLADVKRLIAWIRDHGHAYGADPDMLLLAGGSAGGHLASIAALTQNDPRYQPGLEGADTSVTAVASVYGWYGGYYEVGDATSPAGVLGHPADGAPPFFIAHGTADTLATIGTARRFVAHLRAASPNPVVFAALPHGQHAFDLFHSFRFSAVVDGIEAFAAWVRTRAIADGRPSPPGRGTAPLPPGGPPPP